MKTDSRLKAEVTEELAFDPAVNETHIGVSVKDGVVTLSGHLDSFAGKHAAERAVRRVAGVRGVAIELDVRLRPGHERSDTEIAVNAARALAVNSLVPPEAVKVEVEHGRLVLTGQVDRAWQLASAEQAVAHLHGVRDVVNRIAIRVHASPADVGERISGALARQAAREAQHIGVEVNGSIVTLRGKVRSLAEQEAAIGSAFSAHGVTQVVNKLQVEP